MRDIHARSPHRGLKVQPEFIAAEGFEGVVFQFFAVGVADFDGAVVADSEELVAGDDCDAFGVARKIFADGARFCGDAIPAVEVRAAIFSVGAGDDEVTVSVGRNAADAHAGEVKQERFSEGGFLAGDEVVRIEERNDQSFALRNGISKTDQEMTFRCGREAFDVQSALTLGWPAGGALQIERGECRLFQQVQHKGGIKSADGAKTDAATATDDFSGEEAMTGGLKFAFGVGTVGGDPEDAVTEARCAFEVDLLRAFLEIIKPGEVEGLNWKARLGPGVDPQDIIFIVSHDEQIVREHFQSGGVTHSAEGFPGRFGVRLQRAEGEYEQIDRQLQNYILH